MNCDLWNVSNAIHLDHPNRVTRSPCSIPAMVYGNIRQVLPQLDELKAIADNNDTSFVCLTETWLNADISDSACVLSGYTCFRKDRCFANCGVVCIYVKSTHPCHLLPDFDDPQIESIWVKVRPHRLPRGTSALLIGTVYHPLSSSAEQNPLLISHIQRNIEAFL